MLKTARTDNKKEFKKLIKKIRRDPENGLRLFYEKYAKIITIAAQIICKSEHRTSEVVSEVLVKIWKFAQKPSEIDAPESWIYVVTVNTAKDIMRRHFADYAHSAMGGDCALSLESNIDENIISEGDEIQAVIDEHSFYWTIKDLSETEQTVMVYKFVLLYTFQEIADEMRKPLSSITSVYYRALDKIRDKELLP